MILSVFSYKLILATPSIRLVGYAFWSSLLCLGWNVGLTQSIQISGLHSAKQLKQLEQAWSQIEDSASLQQAADIHILTLHQRGFLEAKLIAIQAHLQAWKVQFQQGPHYLYRTIELEGLTPLYSQKTELDRLADKHAPVNWDDLEQRLNSCLQLFQEEGYPFASFRELAVNYEASGQDSIWVDVHYLFDAGPLTHIDSIDITGNHRERDPFIYSLIRLKPGDLYNQKTIAAIPGILNNSIYYQNVSPARVGFHPKRGAKVILNLERKRAGKFDLLLGLQPPQNNTQRLGFTGTMDIVLVSPLRQGELLEFRFDYLTAGTQQTEARLILPYILRTPLKIEGSFEMQKQEEDFLNLNTEAMLLYAINPFLSASFFVRTRNSRVLDSTLRDTNNNSANQLDGNRQLLGAGLVYEQLDYRNNPSRGLEARLGLAIGRRTILPNRFISPELYEGRDLEQPIREAELSVKWYRQLFRRQVLHLGNHTYWLGMKDYLRNDQLQVGGSKSIRGFNEKSFFTNFYSFFTAEYRFQLERDSYLFLFGDYAYLEDQVREEVLFPYGVGLGMNYGTKAGIISIVYAIGSTRDIPFQPSRGRIHIGIVNQF
ncbi:MAG: BamA/TamA family outer membrane protein [Bacteroidota bacterium]